MPDASTFLWIAASVAAAAADVNPNGIKMLLAKGLSTFPIKFRWRNCQNNYSKRWKNSRKY